MEIILSWQVILEVNYNTFMLGLGFFFILILLTYWLFHF